MELLHGDAEIGDDLLERDPLPVYLKYSGTSEETWPGMYS
jgi:hypothetical protein